MVQTLYIVLATAVVLCLYPVDGSKAFNWCNKHVQEDLFYSYCCSTVNSGKTFLTATDEGGVLTIACPNSLPTSCREYRFSSCSEVLAHFPDAVSGYYDILMPNGEYTAVYCNMDGNDCDGEGGWMRIAYVDMTVPNAQCPAGLSPIQYNNIGHPLCNKPSPEAAGCASSHFTTSGLSYTKVCGRLRGYQFRSPDGLYPVAGGSNDINGVYLDGASITYGSPRTHIWSYAGGLTEGTETGWYCPCNQGSVYSTPSFVGQDYYCESAVNPGGAWATVLYPDDPLWDGANCDGPEAACCTNAKMPWFTKSLAGSTNDDIELRLCSSQSAPDIEGTPLEVIEILVK